MNSELFGVYIDGRNRTDALIEKNNTDHFNLYKYTRDADDDIRKELSDLKAELAVTGLVGRNAYGCLPCGFTQPASETPAP